MPSVVRIKSAAAPVPDIVTSRLSAAPARTPTSKSSVKLSPALFIVTNVGRF